MRSPIKTQVSYKARSKDEESLLFLTLERSPPKPDRLSVKCDRSTARNRVSCQDFRFIANILIETRFLGLPRKRRAIAACWELVDFGIEVRSLTSEKPGFFPRFSIYYQHFHRNPVSGFAKKKKCDRLLSGKRRSL